MLPESRSQLWRLCFGSVFAVILALLTMGGEARSAESTVATAAKAGPSTPGTTVKASEPFAEDSPRAALVEFNRLTRHGDYAGAARYLDLSAVVQSEGPLLAKHLREVLDRHLRIDIERLSPYSRGGSSEGAPSDHEQLGNVPGAAGKPEPVVMERLTVQKEARWAFSAATVSRIEIWYDHLENRWLLERLPNWSLGVGPHELRLWQWIALLPLLLFGMLTGSLVTRVTLRVVRGLASELGAESTRHVRGPATLAIAILTCYVLLPWLGLYEPADFFVRRGLSAALLGALFWALWKAVDLSQHKVSSAAWAKSSHTGMSLLLLGARLGKFLVGSFAFVAVLAELGYPVTSIIAGLGIGGIALALAAQKTVENLFGAFSLAVDQPFREGDVIQVDGITGTVEAIGLRSTRLRSAERTLISIPNGKLCEMRIETISARDRMRFQCIVGVGHTGAEQLRDITRTMGRRLRENPSVVLETLSVRLIAVTDSAMNVEIAALLATTNAEEFLQQREALLLAIVAVIDESGAGLAHPVSHVKLSSQAATAPCHTTPAAERPAGPSSDTEG